MRTSLLIGDAEALQDAHAGVASLAGDADAYLTLGPAPSAGGPWRTPGGVIGTTSLAAFEAAAAAARTHARIVGEFAGLRLNGLPLGPVLATRFQRMAVREAYLGAALKDLAARGVKRLILHAAAQAPEVYAAIDAARRSGAVTIDDVCRVGRSGVHPASLHPFAEPRPGANSAAAEANWPVEALEGSAEHGGVVWLKAGDKPYLTRVFGPIREALAQQDLAISEVDAASLTQRAGGDGDGAKAEIARVEAAAREALARLYAGAHAPECRSALLAAGADRFRKTIEAGMRALAGASAILDDARPRAVVAPELISTSAAALLEAAADTPVFTSFATPIGPSFADLARVDARATYLVSGRSAVRALKRRGVPSEAVQTIGAPHLHDLVKGETETVRQQARTSLEVAPDARLLVIAASEAGAPWIADALSWAETNQIQTLQVIAPSWALDQNAAGAEALAAADLVITDHPGNAAEAAVAGVAAVLIAPGGPVSTGHDIRRLHVGIADPNERGSVTAALDAASPPGEEALATARLAFAAGTRDAEPTETAARLIANAQQRKSAPIPATATTLRST